MRYFVCMTMISSNTSWVPSTESYGARLALVRWKMGWNLREAERECGLSQNTWGGYEEGREPRKLIEVSDKIAIRTGVDRMWLLTGQGSPDSQITSSPGRPSD